VWDRARPAFYSIRSDRSGTVRATSRGCGVLRAVSIEKGRLGNKTTIASLTVS
jgi:hypothetical protein